MPGIWMILLAAAVFGLSGFPALLLPARSPIGQRIASALMAIGGILGLAGIIVPGESAFEAAWLLPWGRFSVALDPISILFLAPVFVVPTLGSVYGLGYWKQVEHQDNGRGLGLAYGLLAGAMALVVIARDGVLFMIAWEVMALAAYFAATTEQENPEVRKAGWVYLVATHAGTLCLLAMFALWHRITGSFALSPAVMSATAAAPLFVLALIGFGFKAGLMPLHVWLPGAHANAPSHVSAIMSGVMLKMGVYGIVRMTGLLPVTGQWLGVTVLCVGAVTGVAGIAFAIGQHDLKRLLAYSSIENIGIIAMGLGLALIGRAVNRPDWVMLGMCAALLHVWNHSLFKSLLFLNAGAIIHATGTREIDRLGGLARHTPRAAVLFIVGAVAISALPPLNGFAGEWLLYAGLFRTLGLDGQSVSPVVGVAAVALALIGALAVACFVKLTGAVFLGAPRDPSVSHAHDPAAPMLVPMITLALGCVALGLFPLLAAAPLENAARAWSSMPEAAPITGFVPLAWISYLGLGLVALMIVVAVIINLRMKVVARAGTWDCGYARPANSMQYTGSSFGQSLVNLFGAILWPRQHKSELRGLFPLSTRFKSYVPDTVLDRIVQPLLTVVGRQFARLHWFQHGETQLYVLYVLVILIGLLAWGVMA